jgi:hypothetical protein
MSCFLMNVGDIATIAKQAKRPPYCSCSDLSYYNLVTKERVTFDSVADLAKSLALANIASCEARYPNYGVAGGFLDDENEVESFIKEVVVQAKTLFRSYKKPLKMVDLIKRFEYQASEVPNWVETDTYWVLQCIKNNLLLEAIRDMEEEEEAA